MTMPCDHPFKISFPAGAGASTFNRDLFDRLMELAEFKREAARAPKPKLKRKPPRLDPIKSMAKVIAKNPDLVGRYKPDGEIEIASSKATPPIVTNEIDLDAGADDHVFNAIAAIRRGSHGAH
jgi:hypothetical protein